ncbi:hypothetical protein ACNKHP_18195 [Shigella boydii]
MKASAPSKIVIKHLTFFVRQLQKASYNCLNYIHFLYTPSHQCDISPPHARTRGQIQLDLVQANRFWCHDFVVFAVFQHAILRGVPEECTGSAPLPTMALFAGIGVFTNLAN